jgi:hypothetical protein
LTIEGSITADTGYIGGSSGWTIAAGTAYIGGGSSQSSSPGILGMQLNSTTSGSGSVYGWNTKLAGLTMTWHQSSNAGHLVMGQIMSDVTTVKDNHFGLQMMNHQGKEYFALAYDSNSGSGSTGAYNRIAGWTFDEDTIYKDDSGYIGITTNASADAGGNSAFFCGATDEDGTGNTISFGSDGKIRGSGIYVRDGKEWNIEQSRLFGDGADGTFLIERTPTHYEITATHINGGTAISIQNGDTGASNTGSGGGIGSLDGDTDWATVTWNGPASHPDYSAYEVYRIRLDRDVYLEKLTVSYNSTYHFVIDTNGYRLFVRDGIYFDSSFSSSSHKIYLRNRGIDGTEGDRGSSGNIGSIGNTVSGGAGGSGDGLMGEGAPSGTLLGGKDGKNGGDGGVGGTYYQSNWGEDGGDGVNGSNGSSATNSIDGRDGRAGGRGGTGTDGSISQSGSGGTQGSSSSGGPGTMVNTRLQSTDPHILTSFRDIMGTNVYPLRIQPSAGGGSGGGGSGGGAGAHISAEKGLSGGGGGEGGGSGGSGGVVMLCVRIIKRLGNGGVLEVDATGGDGGDGGDGGERGFYNAVE